jgi:hypothetical protein
MRVLVPRRIIGLGILVALLCMTPILTPAPTFAKPAPWQDIGPTDPSPTPTGDGDGTVVKAPPLGQTPNAGQTPNTAASVVRARTSYGSRYWNFLRLWLLGFSLRWYR